MHIHNKHDNAHIHIHPCINAIVYGIQAMQIIETRILTHCDTAGHRDVMRTHNHAYAYVYVDVYV